jgi:hypothetical protein
MVRPYPLFLEFSGLVATAVAALYSDSSGEDAVILDETMLMVSGD